MSSSISVANYFINKAIMTQGADLTPMKLLKLVYIAHGWHRAFFGQNLINDEIEAWRYGPVIPQLYDQIKKYGKGQITSFLNGGVIGDQYNPFPAQDTQALLDQVWNSYGSLDGLQLSALTHQQNTPWDETWKECGGNPWAGATIPNDRIEQHYRELLSARTRQAQ